MADIRIPAELTRTQLKYNGEAGRAFIEALPRRAADLLDRWQLRVTGPSMYGMASLVLPVQRADGSRAALKLQLLDEESEGEPVGLRAWDGAGVVHLLDHDPATGTLLLERLDEQRHLSTLVQRGDAREATRILAGLLARLTAVEAPPGLRRLGDIARDMLDDVPDAVGSALVDAPARQTLLACASAVRDVVGEPGDRLLHWDLHFDNVLAADREPWLAIDPKPLAGDPGFDLMPALFNELADSADSFDAAEVLYRFDLLTETLSLDRSRAASWTLGRALQNLLWNVEDDDPLDADQLAIAELLREEYL
ncbi:aminoglycoside phosphotransferase family protein [Streptomyces sp. LHD-70]|uniref:aminoglycoside phosphotransferase family protein n=1 Tax=Streptomyces sp. LHD-70 TaxID=3072140 RepID=UPI00280F98AC|nr:aminoglycoside phosphotransferase family protein [Streptomyces sp. LHD-70]MDQ8704761.1 aminoglycoside phosphotransferase family protein [Streptomyces sp. LHD-70]